MTWRVDCSAEHVMKWSPSRTKRTVAILIEQFGRHQNHAILTSLPNETVVECQRRAF